ncbi:Protein phosphatase 2C [Entamoeba marina]
MSSKSSDGFFGDYDDSTDSSEEEFIRQQEEQQRVHLPRKSSTILIEKGKSAVLVSDNNIDISEYDSDDEDGNVSDISRYESNNRFNVSVSQTCGRRNYNEDRVASCVTDDGVSLYAVFDGHNGAQAASICTDQLKLMYKRHNGSLVDVFSGLHELVAKQTPAGCTATVIAVKNDTIEVACCGDSPGYIVKKDSTIQKVTKDHKPTDPDEEAMIVKNGGMVLNLMGMKRVNGQIMVTRSIGDKSLHPPLTCVPDIQTIPLKDVMFICAMSDGVTDVLNEGDIVRILSSTESLVMKSQLLRNNAYKGGSRDNICVIVIEV